MRERFALGLNERQAAQFAMELIEKTKVSGLLAVGWRRCCSMSLTRARPHAGLGQVGLLRLLPGEAERHSVCQLRRRECLCRVQCLLLLSLAGPWSDGVPGAEAHDDGSWLAERRAPPAARHGDYLAAPALRRAARRRASVSTRLVARPLFPTLTSASACPSRLPSAQPDPSAQTSFNLHPSLRLHLAAPLALWPST